MDYVCTSLHAAVFYAHKNIALLISLSKNMSTTSICADLHLWGVPTALREAGGENCKTEHEQNYQKFFCFCNGQYFVTGNEIPSYKIVLLGEQGTGKSCLVKRLQTCQTDPWRTCPIYKPTVIGNVHSHTSPGLCHLYIVDTSGRSETNEAATRNLYLQYLDCVVFVFALDEPETLEKLKQWNESFESEFKGDMTSIHKVVVGTKMDQMRHLHVRGSVSLQEEASSFAASINATFCVTSSLRALNVHDTFLKISQVLVSRPPCLGLTPRQGYENIISEADKAIVIGDELKSTASEVIFPDPVLVQHGEGMVTSFAMSNLEQGVILKVEKETGAEKQLLWKLSAKR